LNSKISGRAEDYLRGIYEIVERKGFARVRDIARELNVKPSSVVEMLKKLQEMNLVIYKKYGGVRLTDKGEELAEVVKRRHETFRKFLELILVRRKWRSGTPIFLSIDFIQRQYYSLPDLLSL